MNLVGPFKEPTNLSHDSISIYVRIGDGVRTTKYFDIVNSSDDQIKPDIVTFNLDIGNATTTQLNLSLQFMTSGDDALSIQMSVDTHTLNTQMGAICGGIILIALNVLIISEVKYALIIQKGKYFLNKLHI